MIEIPTVIVLGAGASAPFGFPSGKGLLKKLCHELKRAGAQSVLKEQAFSKEDIVTFRHELGGSGQSSVDAFLENRPEFSPLGKAAIAAALLPYETEHSIIDYWLQAGANPNVPAETVRAKGNCE